MKPPLVAAFLIRRIELPNQKFTQYKMLLNITVLPGDGIGPEVTEQAVRVLQALADAFGHQVQLQNKPIGGAALLTANDPLPADTIQACLSAGAVLLGAVGDPAFDKNPGHLRPEAGLLRIRRELGAYANLRPAVFFPALEDSSPLRAEIVRGTDIMIVRELLGGAYFGQPRSIQGEPGAREAVNTMRYAEHEVERIARVAFGLAMKRKKKVLSVDKANVLECSRLWRDVVTRIGKDYPEVKLGHQYVDSAAMLLVQRPTDFDVVLTENMFGDILSAAMMLRHSFHLQREAAAIEQAVSAALSQGARTADLAGKSQALSTVEMGARVVENVRLTA